MINNRLQFKQTNINYSHKSKDRNIYIDNINVWTSNPLIAGNSKLSNKILIFDLLAGNTCTNCKQCSKTCYAIKDQNRYPTVWNKRAINTYLVHSQLFYLQQLIIKQLKNTKKDIIRIHSSGDFISQNYIDMWTNIALVFSDKHFYSYTKVFNKYSFNGFLSLKNTNIVNSILPDNSINYGSLKYIVNKAKQFNIDICPYGIIKESVKCGDTCCKCLHNEYMLFLKH